MQSFRAAVIQTASVSFDAARSIDKLAELVREAAAKGAKLALLPEAFIGGIQAKKLARYVLCALARIRMVVLERRSAGQLSAASVRQ